MQTKAEEIEVKFYLTDPEGFVSRLTAAGAVLKTARIYERDLRFDDVKRSLKAADQVLRLRMDKHATLTYKGYGVLKSGTSARPEFEVRVSDFDTTQKILEALGYHPYLIYEKFRTTYDLMLCEVVLDEMPYGWFCEIEGNSPKMIKQVAESLELRWNARIVESYTMLFQYCKEKLALDFNDLTFTNFKDITPAAQDLGVNPADR
ncbi:MAG: class IV adenylate cyclase [Anaerolineaceae bacterium]